MPVTFTLPVYTFQIDFNRHVSNVVYVEWMEIGRLKLLEAVGLAVDRTDAMGFLPVLVETQIRYRRPVFMGEAVEAEVWLSELTELYAWMAFRFYKPGRVLAAEGRQKGLFVRTDTGRPKRLTEAEREVFLPYLQPREP